MLLHFIRTTIQQTMQTGGVDIAPNAVYFSSRISSLQSATGIKIIYNLPGYG